MSGADAPSIIAIHGAPRSGTSWLGQLFNSSEHVAYRYQPFFAHAFRGRIDVSTGPAGLERFFDDLLSTDDDFVLQRASLALAGYELAFDKRGITHLVYKEVRFHDLLEPLLERMPRLHAVGIVRDPRAVIASWAAAPREFRPEWCLHDEWREAPSKNGGQPENWYGFVRWRELAVLFLRLRERFPGQFSLVRYEDLVAAPGATLGGLFEACGLPMTLQVHDFLRRSRGEDDGSPYGVLRDARRTSSPDLDASVRDAIESELRGDPAECFLAPNLGKRA